MKPIFLIELGNKELDDLQTPIIVEMWKQKNHGSKRRKYNETFTEKEREKIQYYYKLFYNWYRIEGTPQPHRFKSIKNVHLIKRVVAFFATL